MGMVTLYTDDGPESAQAIDLLRAHNIPFQEIRKDRDVGFDDEWHFPTISATRNVFHHSGMFWVKQAICELTSCPVLYLDELADNHELTRIFDESQIPVVTFFARELAHQDPYGFWPEHHQFPTLFIQSKDSTSQKS